MKFYCDKCQTKYSIADEKIAGKVLKVRCKKCAHVITVREPTAPVNSAAQAVRSAKGPTPPPSPARVQWYYSVNGETIGPFALHVIQRMFARGELGDGVHVWNESFTAWKPVFEVSEFRASLEQALKVRPKAQTLGISQALEAIQNDDNRIHANAAVAKTVQEDREPFAENDQSLARASASVDPAPSKVAADKLDTFVEEDGPAVLKGKEPAMAAQAPKKPLPGLFSKGPRTLEQGAVEAPQATGRSERLEKLRERLRGSDEMSDGRRQEELDVALGDTVDAGNDGALNELASPDGSAELEALGTESVHDGLFSERGSAESAEEDHLYDDEEEPEGDKVPFFPAAPRLESKGAPAAQSRSDQISGSLLIQLNSIQKQGRGKTIAIGVIGVLLMAGVIGTAIYFVGQKVEAEEEEAPRMIAGVQTSDPVFHRYKKKDHERVRNLVELEEGVITVEEGEAFDVEERDLQKKVPVARSEGTGPARVPVAAPVDDFEAAMNGATAAAGPSTGLSRTSAPGGGARIDGDRGARVAAPSGTLANDDRFNAMAAAQAGTGGAPIYRPTESMERRKQASASASTGLTAEQAQQGMQHVRRSIGLCRERHMRRGGTIEARKIYVTVEVQTTGRVTSFSVEPAAVRDTEFDRCMQSHMGRWNFSSFSGEAVIFRAPFVLN